MDVTVLLAALAVWFVTSCLVAWAVGRASRLGNAVSNAPAATTERRQRDSDRRLGSDRRHQEDRRKNSRIAPDRRSADRRLMDRRLNWAA